MSSRLRTSLPIIVLSVGIAFHAFGQGTFQNLDFEDGTFIPIPGDLYNRVQWTPAMPGWAGYLGTNQIDRLLYNDQFLSNAGISIWGPNQPVAPLHGAYYAQLHNGTDPSDPTATRRLTAAITQVGTIPDTAQSLRFYLAFGGISVFFSGQQIPLTELASFPEGYSIYGGDISAFAGQTGELRFQGICFFDDIQFSPEPIPEPSTFCLFGLGALLLGWRRFSKRP